MFSEHSVISISLFGRREKRDASRMSCFAWIFRFMVGGIQLSSILVRVRLFCRRICTWCRASWHRSCLFRVFDRVVRWPQILLEFSENESPAGMWERVEAGNIAVFRAQSSDGRSIATFYYVVSAWAETRSFTCIGPVGILEFVPHLSSSWPR